MTELSRSIVRKLGHVPQASYEHAPICIDQEIAGNPAGHVLLP
jgi:hypothetical protein